jgi:DNA ligase-1
MKGETAPSDLTLLRYPVLATPKLDGIRALKVNGEIKTASFKPLPNLYTRKILEEILPEGADGELFVDGATEMGEQTHAFMKVSGEPAFHYYMFDYVAGGLSQTYASRMFNMLVATDALFEKNPLAKKHIVPWAPINLGNARVLGEFLDDCLAKGFEGVMIRDPDGPYKCGRGTVKQQWLLKIKPFEDGEGRIVGFDEQEANNNAADKDAFGRTKRSSCKEGKVGKGTLGAFVVQRLADNLEFRVGTGKGLTNVLRRQIWDNQKAWLGKVVKYKHQAIGSKDAPRIAIYLGVRDERDMTKGY